VLPHCIQYSIRIADLLDVSLQPIQPLSIFTISCPRESTKHFAGSSVRHRALHISSFLVLDCENDVNPAISLMFDRLYFSVISVFTVGFGGAVPITSTGRGVAALTVLTSAVLVLLLPSEIVSVTMQDRIDRPCSKATEVEGAEKFRSPSIDLRDRHILLNSGAPWPSSSFARCVNACNATQAAVLAGFIVKCPKFHLRGHQLHARLCRNCAGLLLLTKSRPFGT
jgi:hypothetical protein